MTGSCWRLLAAFSLIFVTPMVLRGQDAAADRPPILVLPFSPPRYSLRIAPGRIPPSPSPPGRHPVGRDPVDRYPFPPGAIAFQNMVRSAGLIFPGRLTLIGRPASPSGPHPAATAVTFQ